MENLKDKFSVMNRDFAFRTEQTDELTYHPEYKEIGKLKIEANFKGLKGVTDFDTHDNLAIKARKKKRDRNRAESASMMDESLG